MTNADKCTVLVSGIEDHLWALRYIPEGYNDFVHLNYFYLPRMSLRS